MRRITLLTIAIVAAGVASSVAGAGREDGSISLVAYSTPKTAMAKVISAWQQTPAGKGVSFTTSYGPSGDQAKAVAAGLKADVVFLSTGDDVDTLVDAGLVSAKWHVLAAYAAARREGKTDKQAIAFVTKLFKNVVSQDSSGRNATNTFLAG